MSEVVRSAQFQARRVALAAVAGGAAAAAANVGLFLIGRYLGVDFVIRPDPAGPVQVIGGANVAIASFLPALFAGGLLMLLARFTTKPRMVFGVIATVFAVLSLAGPMTVGGAATSGRAVLAVMHLVAAALITGALVSGTGAPSESQSPP